MIPGFFAAAAGDVAPPIPVSTPFFDGDPMLSSGWEVVSGPPGFYHAGKTYVAWQFVGFGGNKGVHVAAFDHGTATWSERYAAGNFPLSNDDHGHPALVRDDEGYIHCFFGSHNTGHRYSVTTAPDDISAWSQRPDIGSSMSYPKAVLVGPTIYLFARNDAASNRTLAFSTMTPVAGAGAFSAFTNLVDFGTSSRVYTTETHLIGTEIHFCCMYTALADVARQHVYYYRLDTATGAVKNYNGTTTVAGASLPISKTLSDSDFRIFSHGSRDGDVPSLQFDSSGNAHVLFADGATPTYELKHIALLGGSWSAPATVATVTDISPSSGYVGTYCLVPGASGQMEAWYNVDGDKMRRVRSAAGSWLPAETIKEAVTFDFVQAAAIKDAHGGLRTVFSENSGGAVDANAALLGLYAYGDSGPVNSTIDMTSIDPSWADVELMLGCRGTTASAYAVDDSPASIRGALNGNPQFTTATIPFAGASSLSFNGSGDFVHIESAGAHSMAVAAKTFDCWLRLSSLGRLQLIAGKRAPSSPGGEREWQVIVNAANRLQFIGWGTTGGISFNITGVTALTTGAWYFVSAVKDGAACRLYLNGGLEASGTISGAVGAGNGPTIIGRDPTNASRDLNGWLSEVRITAAARYSSAFTPPSGPFPRR